MSPDEDCAGCIGWTNLYQKGKRMKNLPRGVIGGILSVMCLALSACAPTFHKPFTEEARKQVGNLEVRVVIPQEAVIFSARAPGVAIATGGGLIPALIDSSIQKSRQMEFGSSIRETLDAIVDYDFREVYASQLEKAVREQFPVTVGVASVVSRVPSQEELAGLIAATKGDKAYLQLLTRYEIEPNLSALTIRTSASLWRGTSAEKVYGNHLIYQAPLPTIDMKVNGPAWAADGGKLFREQALIGIRETIRMLALDLSGRGLLAAGKTDEPQKYKVNISGLPRDYPGRKVDGGDSRIVIRDRDGALFSLAVER